ncbi:Dinitrogenase iron-molybdenum cofactor [Vibrio aerogenes CECT 7868]|uniref:Dinitrogenase iron-molybdenum cofactor n=1 Tax=Vibrio aerogenes CECT 7868 TaxID=1216006 RepID=A0A1M5XS31_9VIBR|nr:NifB/NifX family molybdenum-iron cluster-binding protein [Vibrio aerogenes]SHI02482.1 Dinitrogenase iron-molybdenum cofactor [Vibrio aerogenes CECT 7868]
MIYALPSRNGEPHNHFSKAEQLMIVNEETRHITVADIPETQSHCGRKKAFMAIFDQYQVEAVVVRQIGESMLKHLFDHQLRVFACPRGKAADALNLSELEEVTGLGYAKASPNKDKKNKSCCHHKHQGSSRLSPPASGEINLSGTHFKRV